MSVQPISVPFVCYLDDVEQKDPKEYLWTNIVKAAGLAVGTTQTVWSSLNKRGKRIPRGNLQRIEEGGMPTTKALLEISAALGVELWQLLVPPGDQAEKADADTGIEDAIRSVGDALGKIPESRRTLALAVIADYAMDPSPEALAHARRILGGEIPEPEKLRQAGGQG